MVGHVTGHEGRLAPRNVRGVHPARAPRAPRTAQVLTASHTDSVREAEYSRLASEWESLVRREAVVWARFHRYWMRQASSASLPLLAVRYEDLLDGKRRQESKYSRLLL